MQSAGARFRHSGLERLYRYWRARLDGARQIMPASSLDPVEFPEGPPCLAEQLLLPMAADHAGVSHILGGVFY